MKLPKNCPSCDAIETVHPLFDGPDDIVLECIWCYAIVTLVVWNVIEDRIHHGFNCVPMDELGEIVFLHFARNKEDAQDWVRRNCNAATEPVLN